MTYLFFVLFLVFCFWCVGAYNHFVGISKRSGEAWRDIGVELARRHDLSSKLVKAARASVPGETQVYAKLDKTLADAGAAVSLSEKASKEQELSVALKSLFSLAEKYPELSSDEQFLKFAEELADAENKIQAARRFYNAHVRDYSAAREKFPGSLVTSLFGFKPLLPFESGADPKPRA